MIDEPGQSDRPLVVPLEDTTMLKTISAALLAVSVLAAPALAAGSGKTNEATAVKTTHAPAVRAVQVKPSVLNANARMSHHHKHFRHHRHHPRMGALKTHQFSKVTSKHITPATKRG
jgi:hypothetical protein